MEVAVPEEPQKKIFRARKTMKMSDRQQLETLHNTLSSAASNSSSSPSPSSRPQTPLVNGTHVEDCQKAKEKEKDLQQQPSSSPSHSRSPSPSGKKGSEKGNVDEKQTEKKDDKKLEGSDVDKMETSKSDKKEDPKKAPVDQLINGETPAVDIERAPIDNGSAEEKEEKGTKSTSSSASGSPAADLECDPEVKEGFLFLSEEDEGQGDKDEAKEKSEAKMDVDAVKDEKKDDVKAADGTGISTPAGKKRSFSSEGAKDGQKDVEVKDERAGKKARVEGVELEAQLELKITADAGSRLKLEKVVQQLVEDRLRVLQLTVFDRNLKELKERVEKIDSATKQQSALQHISSLQTKISRLAKKFGAANQASENSRKAQEAAAAAAAAAKASATNTSTITQRGYERTTLDPKLPNASLGSANSSATPTQPKPLSTPTTASSALAAPAPILQILSTATGSTPSSSASLTGQAQTGTLLLQTRPTAGVMTTNTTAAGGQSMSIQPLLIQLPLAMANGQAGPLAGGVGLIPVSSLGTVNNLNKAKTTTATTTIILQKSAGNVVSSSSPSSSSTAPQMSSGRSLYQGGSSNVNSPNAAVSATARTPTQCAAVLGVVRGSSSPATTGPAATGSAAAATGPPSASAMASKTDNQASSSTPAKSPSQSARPKSSFIDLTEDDDDVQVTGVQKATAPSVAPSAPRPSAPPPLVTSSSAAGRTTIQHRPSVDSPSKSRPGSSSSASLPPLPLAPAPPARLPPEATHTSPPQQPQLKLARVQSQNGIVLSWCVAETDRSCAAVDSYHLYAYHQDHQGSTSSSSSQLWKKIGEVKALPLPMACTLTQFVSGSTYYFAVRAKDVYGRFGPFCEPQCTDVINPPSTSSS